MLGIGAHLIAGNDGVRIVWRDGTDTSVSPWREVCLDREPKSIQGRYFISRLHVQQLGYEAPQLEPQH